jgi:hypothetical protein
VLVNVSKTHNAFIFRVKKSKSNLLEPSDPEDDGTTIHQNIRNHSPDDSVIPEYLNPQSETNLQGDSKTTASAVELVT